MTGFHKFVNSRGIARTINHSAPTSLSKLLKLPNSPKSPQSSPNHDQNIANNLNEAPGDGLAFLNLHARTNDQPTVGQEGHVPARAVIYLALVDIQGLTNILADLTTSQVHQSDDSLIRENITSSTKTTRVD